MHSTHCLGGTDSLVQNIVSQLSMEPPSSNQIHIAASQLAEKPPQACKFKQANARALLELYEEVNVAILGSLHHERRSQRDIAILSKTDAEIPDSRLESE